MEPGLQIASAADTAMTRTYSIWLTHLVAYLVKFVLMHRGGGDDVEGLKVDVVVRNDGAPGMAHQRSHPIGHHLHHHLLVHCTHKRTPIKPLFTPCVDVENNVACDMPGQIPYMNWLILMPLSTSMLNCAISLGREGLGSCFTPTSLLSIEICHQFS